MKEYRCKFKIDKITYWKLKSRRTYDVSKNISLYCVLNLFDKNLKLTVNTFDNGNIHFLDNKILNNWETDF